MKKMVFRNFRYMYCDDFALFLQEMSEKGYHFSGWGMGLEFEKGRPGKREYRVEVFQNASELDTRAEGDTREYSDYCEAAGWTLLDSRRKFCIFRKERADAPEIVTEEERFAVICKAELSLRLKELLVFFLLFVINFAQFWMRSFVECVFNNFFLGIMAFLVFYTLLRGVLFVWTFFRFRKYGRLLEDGGTPYYGIRCRKARILRQNSHWFTALAVSAMLLGCFFYMGSSYAWLTAMYLIILQSSELGIEYFRPSREHHLPVRLGVTFGVVLLYVAAVCYMNIRQEPSSSVQEEAVTVECRESILGRQSVYTITGPLDGIETDFSFPESMRIEICESPYFPVLEKCLASRTDIYRDLNCGVDTTEQWNTVKAVSSILNNCHTLLYPDKMLDVSASRPIREREYEALLQVIEEVREKYGTSSK